VRGESSRGSTTAAHELSQVAAAAASPFLRLGEHGEEKRKGMEEEVGCGVVAPLQDAVARPVGPTPAYGCHSAATRRQRAEAGRPLRHSKFLNMKH
jgi:hypothetical protein